MPKNFLEINRYFALTSYSNTIGQSNNAVSFLGFSLAGKRRDHVDLFIHWLIKQITNTYRNHFPRSYENSSILLPSEVINIVRYSEVIIIYSYFEKGCRKKCTRQSRKALWVVLSSLFFRRNLKEWHERP